MSWVRGGLFLVAITAVLGSASSNQGSAPSLPPVGAMPAGVTWTGQWSTTFGPLKLQQGNTGVEGADVVGVYSYTIKGSGVSGVVAGVMNGNELKIVWVEERSSGKYVGKGRYIMLPNGRAFQGTWGSDSSFTNGGGWNGSR